MSRLLSFLLALSLTTFSFAQDPEPQRLTLESIFASPTFYGDGFNGGRWADEGPVVTYIANGAEGSELVSYNLETDEQTTLIGGLTAPDTGQPFQIEGYAYTADGTKALLYTDSERVWRLNTKGYYYVYDVEAGTLTPLADRDKGFQMFAKFCADGSYAAFVRDRNLFAVDLSTMEEIQLTSDGADGGIINGTSDWVYEEEFGLRDAWRWSPTGHQIAFLQLDESATRDFAMADLRGQYPDMVEFRYPKAGETNSEIRAGVIDVPSGDTRFFDTGTWKAGGDSLEYLPQMGWTPSIDGTHYVWMFRLNRDQTALDVLYGDPSTMAVDTILEERSDVWIDAETGFSDLDVGQITYLDDEDHFVWVSETDGYRHIYLYRNTGELVRQITSGEWDITDFHGTDGKNVFFTATIESPTERQLYRFPLKPKRKSQPERITEGAGWHNVNPSADLRYYIDQYSNVTSPATVSL
ncbi:MAG: DPP IV N-terminal domain-containing protein, partial [Bacteroidota bacterium]